MVSMFAFGSFLSSRGSSLPMTHFVGGCCMFRDIRWIVLILDAIASIQKGVAEAHEHG